MMDNEIKKTLWAAADKLRSNMDAAEYKHIVLGLIFLKYISDSFGEHRAELERRFTDPKDEYFIENETERFKDLEERDYYTAANVFWVPAMSRWEWIRERAKQPTIGKYIDDALIEIENENPRLKGLLDKRFARTQLEPGKLGELVDLISKIGFNGNGHKAKDVLGEVYEYFLGQFANAEGKKGGQFYTPASVVKVLVEVLAPHSGKVYDPCCGSGGMFVQSEKFMESHGGRFGDISIYGQESNPTTWRLVAMNLAIRGMDFNLGKEPADTFLRNQHPDLRANYIMANPPFNVSDWWNAQLEGDPRWQFGTPPAGNANYAWLQHIYYHLAPNGRAGVVLADTSLSTADSSEAPIRRALVDEGSVECIVQLPAQLFTNTQITACLWYLKRPLGKTSANKKSEILFIDASKCGHLEKRKRRVLSDDEITRIASTYERWRVGDPSYASEAGFCQTATIADVAESGYSLEPNKYVRPESQLVQISHRLADASLDDYLNDSLRKLQRETEAIIDSRRTAESLNIATLLKFEHVAKGLADFARNSYRALVKAYFLDYNFTPSIESGSGNDAPRSWSPRTFGELFEERNTRVSELGYFPPVYSVTNSGIQLREGNFTKELSKSVGTYKVAFRGDLVFGLSREIPNLDVCMDDAGAFSPAYSVFAPIDVRYGLLVGTLMRLKLMEQVDILRGGAREGRGLDKEKLKKKTFLIPPLPELDALWSNGERE